MYNNDDLYVGVRQLGVATERQPLILSPSFVQRKQPTSKLQLGQPSVASPSTTIPWVTQLATLSASSSLLSYTDGDNVLRIHDKATLQATRALAWHEGGACTSVNPIGHGFVAAGRKGILGCWDGRQEAPSVSLRAPSHAPYLSVAASDHWIAGGTEMQDATVFIDLWDIRQPNVPVLSYEETHSDDVTSLNFHSNVPAMLLSASSDGLISISDVREPDEDCSVLGVVNTGASLARAGWGGSRRAFSKHSADDVHDEKRLDALLGACYGVSDMQTIGIWGADHFDEILPVRDVRHTHMSITSLLPPWLTEYVIDASTDPTLLQNDDGEGVALFCGNQSGDMALMEVLPPRPGSDPSAPLPSWTLHCTTSGGHDDIVRSVAWDASASTLFSGGEDGRICTWLLSDQQQQAHVDLPENDASFVGSRLDASSSLSGNSLTHAAGPDRQPFKGSDRTHPSGSRASKNTTHRPSYTPY